MPYDPTNNPYIPGDPYSYDLKWMVDKISEWKDPLDSAERAEAAAESASAEADQAEAWARGTIDGTPVTSDDPQYENNSKYWSDEAADLVQNVEDIQDEVRDVLTVQNGAIAVLEGRMDTFTTLPNASTAGDAELQDIRVAANGAVYSTAGDAVRGQVTNINTVVTEINGVVLDKSQLVLGNINASTNGWVYQVRNYGVITKQGYEIPIDAGVRFYLSDYSTYKLSASWRDTDNNYDSSGWITSGYFETTTKGDYVINVQLLDTSGTASIDYVYSILKIEGGRLGEVEKKVSDLTIPPTDNSKISRVKIVDTISNGWAQGVCKIGDLVLMFDASNDDHSNHANVDIYDISDLTTRLFSILHNLGHCASADYNEETDTLLIANGTYAPGVDSIIYLIPNITTLLNNRTDLEYGSSYIYELNITAVPGEGVVACFGETSDVIYAVKIEDGANYDTQLNRYLYKLYIGRGSTNMVSAFPTSSVGTYTPQTDPIPNGTARILIQNTITLAGELQGLKFNGKLILPIDSRNFIHNSKMPYIVYLSVTDRFTVEKMEYLFLADNLGNVIASEAEDILITDTNIGYISNGTYIFKIII